MNTKSWISVRLFLAIFSFVIVALTLVTTVVPFVSPTDYGLAGKLPLFYWAGLFSVVSLLFLGRKSKKWLSVVFVLSILYLFVVPSIVQENAVLLGVSYPAAEGQQITEVGKLPEDRYSIYKYHNFPGFLFFNTILTSITGIPLALICRIAPPLLTALIGIIIYLIFRIKLEPSISIMGTLWFLASWWWVAGNYYSPQQLSFVFFALVFLIFTKFAYMKKSPNRALLVLLLIFSVTIIFSHAFTSMMLLACFVPLVLIGQNRGRYIALYFVIIGFAFLILWAFPFTQWTLHSTLQELPNLFSLQFGRAQLLGSLQQTVTNGFRYYTMLLSILIFIIFISTSIFKFTKQKISDEKFWLICMIGMALPVVVTAYGMSETIIRGFMFMLIPLSFICVKFISKKPVLLAVLLSSLIFISVPAHYGGITVENVARSEIVGASFYLNHVPVDAAYFSMTPSPTFLMWFQSPYSIKYPHYLNILESVTNQSNMVDFQFYQYIIYSQGDVNQFLYYHGKVPIQRSDLENFNKLYDNPFVEIYTNSTYIEVPLPG
ncbi:MAG: hypothetical protein LBQ98_03100 [Nitrososphaerota archaeon]|jgi:hypothetical protein|nr:hypothetical protein [Nitrososphaerota archaeon]